MNRKIKEKLAEYKEDIIADLQDFIKIQSVESAPVQGAPFGAGPRESLDYFLQKASAMGFETLNIHGYAGHADLGEGEKTLGILIHSDVVPAGNDWTKDPFGGEVEDGRIYGRGAIDDKGPAIGALYAMKIVKELGVPLEKKVRIICGTNEETGWGGINYYLERIKAPDIALVPDADFPVIHGEKGILIFKLHKSWTKNMPEGMRLIRVKGGTRPNMVPDYAFADIQCTNSKRAEIYNKLAGWDSEAYFSLEETNEGCMIKVQGVSAHGSLPEKGINAVSHLMDFLETLEWPASQQGLFLNWYKEKIGLEYYGQSMMCDIACPRSGRLVFNVGKIDFSSAGVELSVNIRFPFNTTREEIYKRVEKMAEETGLSLIQMDYQRPIFFDKEDPLIQNLMDVYQDVTGDRDCVPKIIGGGTYARALDKAVAFGCLFPGEPELAHKADESISIESLMRSVEIYAEAIIRLAGRAEA